MVHVLLFERFAKANAQTSERPIFRFTHATSFVLRKPNFYVLETNTILELLATYFILSADQETGLFKPVGNNKLSAQFEIFSWFQYFRFFSLASYVDRDLLRW
jgi:hypothetical protein